MSRWWRAYDEAVDDPKLQRLPPALFRSWFNLMCIASANGGTLPDMVDVAFKLHVTKLKAELTISALMSSGLLDKREDGSIEPHNWPIRQFKSDVTDPTASDRMRRYRKKRNAVTSKTVTVTPPIVQRQNTDSEAKASAQSAAENDLDVADEDPKARLFRLGKTILVSFGIAEKRTGSLIGQWLKQKNDPAGILAALQFSRDRCVAEPIAYVSALLHGNQNGASNGNDRKPGESLGDLGRRLAAEARELERAENLGREDDTFGVDRSRH